MESGGAGARPLRGGGGVTDDSHLVAGGAAGGWVMAEGVRATVPPQPGGALRRGSVRHDGPVTVERGIIGRLPYVGLGGGAPMLFVGGLVSAGRREGVSDRSMPRPRCWGRS